MSLVPRPPRGGPGRLLAVAGAALVLLVYAGTTGTLGAWTAGVVVDSTDSAAGGSLVFGHSAGACAAGPRSSGTVACTGTLVGTDTISDTGTVPVAALSTSVSATSCGPVQLTNQRTATNPMLARTGLAFRATDPWAGTNAVTLSGSGYAAAIAQDTEPAQTLGGTPAGVGVWFKATSGQSGPLASVGSNPTATAGTDGRALVLNANGTVSFFLSTPTATVSSAAGTGYADGAWHFAYVRFVLSSNPLTNDTFTLSVDGATPVVASTPLSAGGLNGYWRLGWAPTTLTGSTTAFFPGSLSNLVVFDGATVASAPSAAQRSSQSSFTTWASAATDQWTLGDSGTTTFTGTLPSIGTTSPCAYVDLAWSFTSPAATAAAAGTRLSTFANGTLRSIAAPGPGVTQTSTLTLSRDATYDAYVTGLLLYLPLTHRVAAGGPWTLTFSWASAAAAVAAP